MARILLVEDDPMLLDIYRPKHQKGGFEVLVANEGEDAIRVAEREVPDAIILDLVLPNRDGWEVLETVRKKDALNKSKIIVLSNLGQKEEVERGLKLGADQYLIKAHYTPSQVVEEL